ncbi:MAG: hypothetical protein WKF59_25420 [Chitinophagaceae bacterium]
MTIPATLVISHDIANSNCIIADEFFSIYKQHTQSLTLALNIKADGLQDELFKLLELYNIHNYFVFDMAIPDTIGYIKKV